MNTNGLVFEFVRPGKGAPRAELLLVPLASDPKPPLPLLASIDRHCDDAVSELVEVGALSDELGSLAHTTRSGAIRRILVVNLGPDQKLDAARLRQAAAAATRWISNAGVRNVVLAIDGLLSSNFEHAVAEWADGMILAGFRFEEHLARNGSRGGSGSSGGNGRRDGDGRVRVALLSGVGAHVDRSLAEIAASAPSAEATNYTRWLSHQPPNVMYPLALADQARQIAREYKLRCTVIESKEAQRLGMNGLLAVGQAADHKPCLIRLDYQGGPRNRPNIVVIGKAITFDTGGISIKPAAGMEAMKFDKCGGTAVLGLMRAAAALRLRCNVVGLVAAAENTLGGNAYRPSDIIRMASGKTVEIISTDAEGRMVLADALWYAQEHCRPAVMIDMATLTGGVVMSLGSACAGLMCTNDALAEELIESGQRTHERLWRLPLWDDYRDLIKGTDSDIRNSSGKRHAHAIVGGMFLREFVRPDVPWAHIDIAGTATDDDGKRATGFGVRLLVDYLRRRGASPG